MKMLKGCSTVFLGSLLLIVWVSSLAQAPTFTLVATGVVVGIVLLRKAQHKQEIEKQRRRAIVEARKSPDLFNFDVSAGTEETKKYEKARHPVAWAEAIQKRYGLAEAALNNATLVVNDDIDQLTAYREDLHQDVIQKYEIAIRPYKADLQFSADQIPHPNELVVPKNFSFPPDLQPKKIFKDLSRVGASMGSKMSSQYFSFKPKASKVRRI